MAAEIPVLIEEGKIKKDWLCIIKFIMSKILRYDYEDVLKRNPNDIKSMIALGCHSINLG